METLQSWLQFTTTKADLMTMVYSGMFYLVLHGIALFFIPIPSLLRKEHEAKQKLISDKLQNSPDINKHTGSPPEIDVKTLAIEKLNSKTVKLRKSTNRLVNDYRWKMVGSVHAIIVSALCCYYWATNTFQVDYTSADLSFEKFILGTTLSYWLIDTIFLAVKHIPSPMEMIVHHAIVFGFLLPPFLYDHWAHEA
jgi:hypothetical protein